MKFSFINPGPNPELPIEDVKKMVGAAPPLGMLYIATYLRENGVDVSIIDEAPQGYSVKGTVDWVKKENPDIIGFSTLSSSYHKAVILAANIKKENPNIVIVFGNFFATFNAERILTKYPFVDFIVRGESEHTSLDLAKCQPCSQAEGVFHPMSENTSTSRVASSARAGVRRWRCPTS